MGGSPDTSVPAKPDDSGTSDASGSSDTQTPPDKPDGDTSSADLGTAADSQTPPDKPDGDTSDPGSSDSQTPPDKPDGDSSSDETKSNADGSFTSDSSSMDPGAMGGGMQMPGDMGMGGSMVMGFTESGEYAIISAADAKISLETSGSSSDTASADNSSSTEASDTSDSSIEITEGDIVTVVMGSNNKASTITILYQASSSGNMGQGGFGDSATDSGTAANTISEDGTYSVETYSSTGDDENALLIDGGTVTLDSITVDKSGGSSSNTESGDFYGINAALLAKNGADVTIKDSTVTSEAQNGNGIFSYGTGTKVTVSDTSVKTTKDNSGGIMTTGEAEMEAENLTVETDGSSAAAIRTDRGGGTVTVNKGTYTTNGYNSPAVYSTAAITVKNAALTAKNSEALVIEGDNSIALEDCEVSGNMSDDKGTSSDENVHCVLVYQSMSGDANEGTSSLSMSGGSLLCKNGDVFHFTNTAATLSLSGVSITNEETNGSLISITGNDASHGWGTAGKNGAQVTFTASGQELEGDIVVDTISTLNMTLKDKSSFKGTINITDNEQGGTAVDNNAVITIEEGSTWTLTGDCKVTSLENNGTIDFNGHTITLADGTVLSK